MTLHPSGQITPKRWQFLECSLENTGLNNNSGSPAANGQKSSLTYLDICQGKLCKRIVRVWPYANSRGAVDILPDLGQSTELMLSLFTQREEEAFSTLALVFEPQSFHAFIIGEKTSQTQWHVISLVEQLCKICSAIFE